MANYSPNYNLYLPSRNDSDVEVDTSLTTNFTNIDNGLADIAINVKTLGAKGDGVTDDTQVIIQAVNDAYTQNRPLNWPNATYLTTANIPYLHQVTHIGKGVIKRGSNLFYLNPTGSLTNTLFVNPTGGITGNDGLSTNESPGSLSEALNTILPNYGPVLNGNWVIQLTTGTYAHAYFPDGLKSVNPITVQGVDVGGHPNIPTTIISDGANASGSGIYASHGTRIILKNLKATGYNNGSSQGFAVGYGSELVTSNCHTDSCYYGIRGLHQSSITVPDGIHSNHTYGIFSLQQNNHYIGNQYATDASMGAIIKNCTYGFGAQEFSTGHVNWVTIQNCIDGVYLQREASVNGDGIQFDTNTRDVRTQTGSNFSATTNTKFSAASSTTVTNLSGNNGGINAIDTFDENYFSQERIYNIVDYNKQIKTTSATYAQVSTLKAPHWHATLDYKVGKGIPFKIHGSLSGTTNTKRLQARISDGTNYQTVGTTLTAPVTGPFMAEGTLYILSATEIFMIMKISVNQSSSFITSSRNTNIDLTKDLTFEVGGYVTDTTGVDYIQVDVVEMRTYG